MLTTLNLAVLIDELRITDTLRPQRDTCAQRCCVGFCAEQQRQRGAWNATPQMPAYAWQQKIVLLFVARAQTTALLHSAQHHPQQPVDVGTRFQPALTGRVAAGETPSRRAVTLWAGPPSTGGSCIDVER